MAMLVEIVYNNSNNSTTMILDFIRPSILRKRNPVLGERDIKKHKLLVSSEQELIESQRMRQLNVDSKTKVRILWTTILVFILLLALASTLAT